MQGQADYPVVTAMINVIAHWWKRRERGRHDLWNLTDSDVERIARDVGVSARELRTLAIRDDQPLPLLRMMGALQLDPAAVDRHDPATFRDLQRVCAMCEDKKRCARDLADGDAAIWFEDYCPNAPTLKALG